MRKFRRLFEVVLAIVSNLLLAVKNGGEQRWAYLVPLALLALFVVLYNLLSKPINKVQTEAARNGAILSHARELQASWDKVLWIRVPLLVVALLAQCFALLIVG